MSNLNVRRRTVVRAAATAALAAALLAAPAANAVAAGPAKASSTAAAPEVRTQKLADGASTARITKVGDHHYTLEILYQGHVLAKIEADQHDAGVNANGMFVVLTFDGKAVSWLGGMQHGEGSLPLPDGSTAKVTKVSRGHWTLQIVDRWGDVRATLDADRKDAAVNANGMYIVLTWDGAFSAWTG
ncbi:hypothetical protein [Streptomyces cinnamoneus]|uniref:Uncharacterized protein n=1 Tax=Streptomyces cinnamoneus TaxID=53446 RepID=A0A918WDQ2_STRCJ|nr:hypothetical protein [Streptomyces cinnamoneus]GHC35243.1 hypothetical protein GCM10010507_05070 [Streptomyces cinnamoneus]